MTPSSSWSKIKVLRLLGVGLLRAGAVALTTTPFDAAEVSTSATTAVSGRVKNAESGS